MEKGKYTIPYESLILIELVIYTYSYNFHSLWILCDFIIIFNLFNLIKKQVLRNYKLTFLILSILFGYLNYHQLNNFYFINFLSFWDSYKHIFVFISSFYLYKKIPQERKDKFIERLYNISIISFFIQVFFILIQHKLNWHFDNLAGTFGDGSTHSVAYFTVVLILLLIRYKKKVLLTLLVISLSFLTSLLSENTGYFVILGIALFFHFMDRINLMKVIVIILISIGVSLLVILGMKNETTRFTINKISSFELTKTYKGAETVRPERGIMMGYAYFLGGWYGRGYGAYSEIYGRKGWLFNTLLDDQLCISEGTHFVAEIGVIGLIISLVLFITLFLTIFKDRKTRLFSILFFVLGMFYGRLLLDERLFFFFTLIFLVWYATKENNVSQNLELK